MSDHEETLPQQPCRNMNYSENNRPISPNLDKRIYGEATL